MKSGLGDDRVLYHCASRVVEVEVEVEPVPSEHAVPGAATELSGTHVADLDVFNGRDLG